MKKRDWKKIADELCACGAKKSQHAGPLHHGGCGAKCAKFTWVAFLGIKGKKI